MSNVLPSEAMLPQWLLGRLAKLMDCEVQLSVAACAACAGCATPIATLAMGGQAGDPEESQSLAEALQRIQ